MTNKVTGNGNKTDLKALQAYYEAMQAKRNEKDEKVEQKPVAKTDVKKVDVSALDATAAQIWGVQLSKGVDTSDKATAARMEAAMKNSPFFAALDELQGIERDESFVDFASKNAMYVDSAKLQKYLQKPLNSETQKGISELTDLMLL